MRVRAQDADSDYTFGQGRANFLVNSPAAVGQTVRTRLKLLRGEWFLDTSDGTPWATEVLGTGTLALYDRAIQSRVEETDNVTAIVKYNSHLDAQRHLTVQMTIDTAFGQTEVSVVL